MTGPGARRIADPAVVLGEAALGEMLDRLRAGLEPRRTVAGWATVDLDRAQRDVADALRAHGPPRVEPAPDEPLLGARSRLLRFPDAWAVLLLEPSTEGRLAASLARYGEGTVALYLLAPPGWREQARRAGFDVSAETAGPLGRERLVLGSPRWGPHLLLVDDAAGSPGDDVPPVTIEG